MLFGKLSEACRTAERAEQSVYADSVFVRRFFRYNRRLAGSAQVGLNPDNEDNKVEQQGSANNEGTGSRRRRLLRLAHLAAPLGARIRGGYSRQPLPTQDRHRAGMRVS